MKKQYFVVGTDANVGESLIAAALLLRAAEAGLKTIGLKPVATGCDEGGHSEEALQLQTVMTQALDYQQVNPVALTPAMEPHLAAQQEGRTLRAGTLAGYCRGSLMTDADFAVVEGVGGWRVPLNNRETLADLAKELRLPVILVVGLRPGCINHALLSAESILRDGLPVVGWVANLLDPDMPCWEESVATLCEWMPGPCLGTIPHLQQASPTILSQHIDIIELLD